MPGKQRPHNGSPSVTVVFGDLVMCMSKGRGGRAAGQTTRAERLPIASSVLLAALSTSRRSASGAGHLLVCAGTPHATLSDPSPGCRTSLVRNCRPADCVLQSLSTSATEDEEAVAVNVHAPHSVHSPTLQCTASSVARQPQQTSTHNSDLYGHAELSKQTTHQQQCSYCCRLRGCRLGTC